jgi:DNA-directed RNA polymerase subunit RPC12/RpoP
MRRLGMSRKAENGSFICAHCSRFVTALTNGSYRNHCPFCLHSLHIDASIGDRANNCRGEMMPIDILFNSKKGYQIVHECQKCGTRRVNKIAENTDMPDDFDEIIKLFKRL